MTDLALDMVCLGQLSKANVCAFQLQYAGEGPEEMSWEKFSISELDQAAAVGVVHPSLVHESPHLICQSHEGA